MTSYTNARRGAGLLDLGTASRPDNAQHEESVCSSIVCLTSVLVADNLDKVVQLPEADFWRANFRMVSNQDNNARSLLRTVCCPLAHPVIRFVRTCFRSAQATSGMNRG